MAILGTLVRGPIKSSGNRFRLDRISAVAIEAMRRLAIPEEVQKSNGFTHPSVPPTARERTAGSSQSNLRYGYISKSTQMGDDEWRSRTHIRLSQSRRSKRESGAIG